MKACITQKLRHRVLAAFILAMGCAVTIGCAAHTTEDARLQAEADQALLNEPIGRDMDQLHESLNQQAEQFPLLQPWPKELPPELILNSERTRESLKFAGDMAKGGNVDGAWKLLAKLCCEPPTQPAWTVLHAEMAALRFQQDDVYPLSARFAAFALQKSPQSGAARLRDQLRRDWLWAWKYEGPLEAVMIPAPAGQARSETPMLYGQGYSNQDVPVDASQVDRNLQHFHVVVFAADSKQYLLSYAVQSRLLMDGKRVYFLERQIGGQPDVLKLYEQVPPYTQVAADVKQHLENASF